MLHLGILDGAILVLFVVAILALGFSAKLRDNSILQFIAAGRNLTLPVFLASLVSTWYGGILGISESATFYGLGTWLLFGIPYYVFGLIYALFLAKKVRAAGELSIPERIQSRWGKPASLVAAILVFLLAVPAAHVLMLGVLTQLATGWSLPISVVLASLVATLFLYKGGLLADVRVGILAFTMMYVGFIVMLGWCLTHYPLVSTLDHIQNRTLLIFTGGQGPIAIASFFVLGAWTLVDPGFHQRVASASSVEVGRKGVLIAVLCWFVFDVLSIGTAMYALALLKPLPSSGLQIYPLFADQILPSGLKGVFLIGILGTVLSAMVGYTLVSGTSFGREFVSRIRNVRTDSEVKTWTRVGFAVAWLIAVLLALNISSVVNLWYQWGGCVVGALLIPVLMAYSPVPRGHANWMTISMIASFVLSMAWLLYSYRTNNTYLNIGYGNGRLFLPTDHGVDNSEYGNATILGIGTLVPGLLISSLSLALGSSMGSKQRINNG